jgi:hypothetical protein
MEHFVAVWLVRHLAFLKAYAMSKKDEGNLKELKIVEEKIFHIASLRPYKFKYFLLTRFPSLHGKAVELKKNLTPGNRY